MSKIFETDKQTLDDLNILGKYKSNSIYSLFNGVVTRGGERLLEQMFTHPLADAEEINKRSAVFKCFRDCESVFPEKHDTFEMVEQYLSSSDGGKSWAGSLLQVLKLKGMKLLSNDPRLDIWQEQVRVTLAFLKKASDYLDALLPVVKETALEGKVRQACALLHNRTIGSLLSVNVAEEEEISMKELFMADKVMGADLNAPLQKLLELFYELDVIVAVSRVARERGFCFAAAYTDEEVSVQLRGVSHPCVPGAVSNNLEVTKRKNIFFLTGANMAGKSTLMKSFGIAVYMAHMGFPVAAEEMRFSVQDGMYTSINVPDNIYKGYSHFYAEVLRVKKVAKEVSRDKRLVVIFDELFKGTNVKDAYDATLAVTSALANRRACSFMISTHIIEVGQELGKKYDNVSFAYLPTVMCGNTPTYTYHLTEGITSDKHGMIIIENEHIVDIIRKRNQHKKGQLQN